MKFAVPTISRLLALASIAAYARPTTANPTDEELTVKGLHVVKEILRRKGVKSPITTNTSTSSKPTSSPTTTISPSPSSTSSGDCQSSISNMIIFGDDLSDVGNWNKLEVNCQGDDVFCGDRQSNGRLVVEYIAETLCIDVTASLDSAGSTVGNNFAVNEASVLNNKGDNTFEAQVNAYLGSLTAAQQTMPKVPPGTLFFNWIGVNDVGKAVAALAHSYTAARAVITGAIAELKRNIKSLIDAGACSFLVLGSLDITIAPVLRFIVQREAVKKGLSGADLQKKVAQLIGFAKHFSEQFNKELEDMLQELTISDGEGCLGAKFIDLIPLMEGVLTSDSYQSKFGTFDPNAKPTDLVCNFRTWDFETEELKDGCYPSMAEDEIDLECTTFPFYDEGHLTTYVYGLMADSFLEEVEDFVQGSRRLLRRGL